MAAIFPRRRAGAVPHRLKELHLYREELDQLCDAEDHIRGRLTLASLAVEFQRDRKILRIRNERRCRNDHRA